MEDNEMLRRESELVDLFIEVIKQVSKTNPKIYPNRWLYGAEVKKKLNISESTLRRLRINNDIPYYKIRRTYYYPSYFFEKKLLENTKKRYGKDWDDE